MFPMEAIIGTLFWSVVLAGVGIRLVRSRASTLVLQKYVVRVQPQPSEQTIVEVVGRMQGVIAFVLTLMGFSPITRLTLTGSELRCESTSLFGQRLQLIPVRQVSNLAAGIHKPIGNLIAAAVLNIAGVTMSWSLGTLVPLAGGLVIGIILVALYAISKKFFVEIHSQGGPPISLLFKPNILEGVPIDATSAMEVIAVIRDLVMASGTTSSEGIVPRPSPINWGTSVPLDGEDSPDGSPFQPFRAETEPEEIIVELEEQEPDTLDSDDPEMKADALLAESKQFASDGDRRRAVRLLKAIVTRYPTTKAGQQARRTLERSGIQV